MTEVINCSNTLSYVSLFLFQIGNNQNCKNETSQVTGIDPLSKIQNLENELAEALEANDMYKTQLKRWVQVVDFVIRSIELFSFLNITSEIGYIIFTFQ